MKINSNLKRLSLHDAHFEKEERNGENIILFFNWSKLDNFIENGIDELIILGETKISFKGIKNENFKIYYDRDKYKVILVPENLGNYWQEVANTDINEDLHMIKLDGMFMKDKENNWVEWTFNYESFEIEWSNHITYTEWKKEKLPNN